MIEMLAPEHDRVLGHRPGFAAGHDGPVAGAATLHVVHAGAAGVERVLSLDQAHAVVDQDLLGTLLDRYLEVVVLHDLDQAVPQACKEKESKKIKLGSILKKIPSNASEGSSFLLSL